MGKMVTPDDVAWMVKATEKQLTDHFKKLSDEELDKELSFMIANRRLPIAFKIGYGFVKAKFQPQLVFDIVSWDNRKAFDTIVEAGTSFAAGYGKHYIHISLYRSTKMAAKLTLTDYPIKHVVAAVAEQLLKAPDGSIEEVSRALKKRQADDKAAKRKAKAKAKK